MTKYIVVTGGVLSGLGKGLAAASIGKLLSSSYKKIPIKCDGYLNVDPGTMNPFEHGEVYVLDDGTEVDMDFGHYERYLGVTCKGEWNLTMGRIFEKIREAERRGDFLGKTVEMIPDVVDMINDWWEEVARTEKADVVLLEIGGTVGDMENELFLESVRRLKNKAGDENFFHVHVTYMPVLFGSGEIKSKPTQHSTILLRERGLVPDMVIGRCSKPLPDTVKRKIAEECDIDPEYVNTGIDTENLFEIPLLFKEEGIGKEIARSLSLKENYRLSAYRKLVEAMNSASDVIKVAICGKYTDLDDSYASVVNALILSAAENKARCEIEFIETTDIEENGSDVAELLKSFDGVIVPGGFGSRGVEGKIEIIRHCREQGIPYLGLCYGLQLAMIEYARNVCGLEGANSTEIDDRTPHPVVIILPEKKNLKDMGGTLRLGAYPAVLKPDTVVRELYGGKKEVSERHRHRYEVNPDYHEVLEGAGVVFSGMSPDGRLVEFIELPDHPYFVATQAHPEFKCPSPLFIGLVQACLKRQKHGDQPADGEKK
jgi:CTP synthase